MEVAERRARLVALFESWLERALAEEVPLAGIEAGILAQLEGQETDGRRMDLYTLFAGLTTLTQEVKLQGRSFKGLTDTVTPLVERLDEVAAGQAEALEAARAVAEQALEIAREAEHAQARAAEERAFRQSIELLLDLRDRLARGVTTAAALLAELDRRRQAGLLARLLPGRLAAGAGPLESAVAALLDGHRLTLAHLDDALRARGVSPIECQGLPFEPYRMSALDSVRSESLPDGVVVEVYRVGYEWNGHLLRAAQVKVARRVQGGEA